MRNSEQEKIEEQELKKLFELRDKLVKVMTPIFGDSIEKMGRIVFDDYNKAKLAEILDCSNIGRHLQTPNLRDRNQPKEDSFNNLIAKVQLLQTHIEQPLKENKELRKKNNELENKNEELHNQLEISEQKNRSIPLYIAGLMTLIALSGWLYFQQPKENKPSPIFSEINNQKGIYDKKQYDGIFKLMGTGNLKHFYIAALDENRKNNRILDKKKALNKNEAIESMQNMITKSERIIYENRTEIENLNLLVQGKKNIIKFIDFLEPRNPLFKLKAEQIVEIDADNIPEDLDYNSYDEALIKCKKDILGKAVSSLDIINSLDNATRISHVNLRKETSALYDCYLKYGEACFGKEGENFKCYKENMKEGKEAECFERSKI